MNINQKQNILEYTINELAKLLVSYDFKPFIAKQIYDWIYKKSVNSFDEMSNISKKAKLFLNENFYFKPFDTKIVQIDKLDETTKFLFILEDNNLIETVLMKFDYGYSVCVTTQVGCNMGCKFCASGLLKKKRNLHTFEIVNQIYSAQKYLTNKNKDSKITNVVVMGIGEPFDNFDNLIKFIKIINCDHGLQIGARKITVSTCGLANKIKLWTTLMPQVGLAISLHAPNDEIRNKIMPINKAFNMDKLLEAVKYYIENTNRRITFEYIMLKDVNDSIDCAIELAKKIKNILCYVNLIPYNPVNEHSFQRSNNVIAFANKLSQLGVTVTIRQEKGTQINAACGQLRANNE